MKSILKYSSKEHKNLAVKCLAVADLCNVSVDQIQDEGCQRVTLVIEDKDLVLTGTSSICFHLSNATTSVYQSSRALQWLGFIDSEISPYPANSAQMSRSLECLESHLSQSGTLSEGDTVGVIDIIVGFPLLLLPPQISGKYPSVKTWLNQVKADNEKWSSQLVTQEQQPKLDTNKSKGKKGHNNPNAKDSKEVGKRKLRVLCIHGYRQSAKTSKEKLGSFRKFASKYADLDFITAPHLIPPTSEEEQDQYGWWFSKDNQSFDAHEDTECDLGFQESVDSIVKAMKEKEGGYDGIFSFSQGASLAAYLCVLHQLGKLDVSFKFCVLVAGFVSRTQNHKKLFEDMLHACTAVEIPTLHVIGDTDRVIEREMSDELLKYFQTPDIIRHPGGHFVPTTGDQKKSFITFFEKMQTSFA